MIQGPITFDRAARWTITALGILCAYFVLDYFSDVLLPFFVAWLLAYLLYPLVRFIENRLKVRIRAVSIIIALVLVLAVLAGVLYCIIQPMLEQFSKLSTALLRYLHSVTMISSFPDAIKTLLTQNADDIENFLTSKDFTTSLKETAPSVVNAVGRTMSGIMKVIESCITLLYMFFILLDYENLSTNWVKIFPESSRPFCQELMHHVSRALSSYFRGQSMVALIMGVLFCIGFTIIGFPMAIGLGILIGIMDMIPYLHTFAIIPAAFLAALKSYETGQSYWVIFGSALAVFAVVQVIIESIVNPKIMGKQMGLNPAVLLLALSIWGALLGVIGLIIALPATTVIITYWKKYVSHNS